MHVFQFRDRLVGDYETFSRSFTRIKAPDIKDFVDREYVAQRFWPAPLIQLNPNFVTGSTIDGLVDAGLLEAECRHIFRVGKETGSMGRPLRLHKHQDEAIRIAQRGESYVLTTGTGSGKSLSYFIPIVNDVLRRKRAGEPCKGIAAIVVYPMNALCNSQLDELERFLTRGYGSGKEPVTYARYTGQENKEERQRLAANPPNILLTNYVMLELIMTRQDPTDLAVVEAAKGLRFLALDELHTYRGRQGADVAMLVRRVRERLSSNLLCVGTSATMASEGVAESRNAVVADIASRLFGTEVKPTNVITETLERVTLETPVDRSSLSRAIGVGVPASATYEGLSRHPIAAWIELRLGLEREGGRPGGKFVRISKPRTLDQAAALLAEESGEVTDVCRRYLSDFLLLAYNTRDSENRSLLAFKLHQFIAGAGDVFSTIERPGERYLTLNGQQYRPGDRGKQLYSLCFCRECGREYYPVWATIADKQIVRVDPRELTERAHEDDEVQFGYFMPDPDGIFDPSNLDSGAYPEEWIDYAGGSPKLRPGYRKYRPLQLHLDTKGGASSAGLAGWYIPGAFRFCLHCAVSYDGSMRSDLAKLSSLTSEGRSSTTTVLTLAAMRYLIGEAADLDLRAKKLLGFTDNRQDASLQAGHFNDFIQILLLRGALLAAIQRQPGGVLKDDVLTQRVFEQLHLDPRDYSSTPDAKGAKAKNTEATLRDVLGYRLYFDLRRGWRFTNPNLEQLRLLKIDYQSLEDCCADDPEWAQCHPLLANAKPSVREKALRELLETMRRGLCVKTIYLDPQYQEQVKNRSFTSLHEPWGLTEDEQLTPHRVMIPRARTGNGDADWNLLFASHRSRFGRHLRNQSLWGAGNPHYPRTFDETTYNTIVDQMLRALATYGLVESMEVEGGRVGYRVDASVLEWRLNTEAEADLTNQFFRVLYENVARLLGGGDRFLHKLEAREHTAQVDSEQREDREERFRSAILPVLFCSPTMELGVDIATLNTVYLRNVPPTPANYAQRGGRAGRVGQPALVITYCAAKSPHDQYFFTDPTRMVAGTVSPPTIDLANEDLVRSHLHSVWLAETGQKLEASIKGILELEKGNDLPVRSDLAANMDLASVRERAAKRAINILGTLAHELTPDVAPWYTPAWLTAMMNGAYKQFDQAFDRWRSLFRATTQQMNRAHAIQMNAAAGEKERKEAEQRYNEARVQLNLLLDSENRLSSDFYTYRYLASQGFLPGYNFPRLPLMAFIPARKEKVARDSFLTRPRFLGLSEFGPQSIIYHEGSTYRVRRAILGIRDEDSVTTSAKLPVRPGRLCPECGYGHFNDQKDFEKCVNCGASLAGGRTLMSLYRIEQVSTRRVMRITSDEEERQRQGYEMITTLRFGESNGHRQYLSASFSNNGEAIAELRYGPAATLWRINLGWRRRKEKSIYGFNIDVRTGQWSKDAQAPEDADGGDAPEAKTVQRIIPFVEDRKNVLLMEPADKLDEAGMATLQYALKRGIEAVFQLESSELAAEALPERENRKVILFYEAAEGGAGVLTRLASEPKAIHRIAVRALELCHYQSRSDNWTNHEDLENLDHDCEAGCYRCLLSYYNQPEHRSIDRRNHKVLDLLCRLTSCDVEKSAAGKSASDLFDELMRQSVSSLEKSWLRYLRAHSLNLPDRAQPLLSDYGTQPDFGYSQIPAVVYIDGPGHETETRRQSDAKITQTLEDAGYTVIRFPKEPAAWPEIFGKFRFVFGEDKTT